MLKSKQRLLALNSKLAETLTSKGVTASADETTTVLINKVSDISSGDDSVFASLIDRSVESIVIPDGVTSIGNYTFYQCGNLQSVRIPDTVTIISNAAFMGCSSLVSIIIPNSVTSIKNQIFRDCNNLESVILSNNIKEIPSQAFYGCKSLKNITIPKGVIYILAAFYGCSNLTNVTMPNTITSISASCFQGCKNLTDVNFEDGFNANGLDLSATTLIERETMVNMFNAFADRTGLTAYTLTLGSTNLAKLTEQDILIATNKNWTLA